MTSLEFQGMATAPCRKLQELLLSIEGIMVHTVPYLLCEHSADPTAVRCTMLHM